MRNQTFGLIVTVLGALLSGWVVYGLLYKQSSIEDKTTQAYILAAVIALHLGLEGWRRGSAPSVPASPIRQILGRTCWLLCITMLALTAFGAAGSSMGWIGFAIGVLGNLIGWGKPLVTMNKILGKQSTES
jgi:hypothetical protein